MTEVLGPAPNCPGGLWFPLQLSYPRPRSYRIRAIAIAWLPPDIDPCLDRMMFGHCRPSHFIVSPAAEVFQTAYLHDQVAHLWRPVRPWCRNHSIISVSVVTSAVWPHYSAAQMIALVGLIAHLRASTISAPIWWSRSLSRQPDVQGLRSPMPIETLQYLVQERTPRSAFDRIADALAKPLPANALRIVDGGLADSRSSDLNLIDRLYEH